MIETLLILTCLNASPEACSNGAQAYYSYSGIEDAITAKSQKLASENPNLARLALVLGVASQGQAIIHLSPERNLTLDTKRSIIGIGTTF